MEQEQEEQTAAVEESPKKDEETPKPKKQPLTEEERRDAKARKAFRKLTAIEDEGGRNLSLRTILGGDILAGQWFRRQFFFIVFLVAIAIVYVANRYACQQEMIDRINLSDSLLDARYKALTRSSELLERTLRSRVEEELTDSTLRTPTTPLYLLKAEKE